MAAQTVPMKLKELSSLPPNLTSTPGGTIFSTTPGGTRITYTRKDLMKYCDTFLSKTPPTNLPQILGVTVPKKNWVKLSSPRQHFEYGKSEDSVQSWIDDKKKKNVEKNRIIPYDDDNFSRNANNNISKKNDFNKNNNNNVNKSNNNGFNKNSNINVNKNSNANNNNGSKKLHNNRCKKSWSFTKQSNSLNTFNRNTNGSQCNKEIFDKPKNERKDSYKQCQKENYEDSRTSPRQFQLEV